MEGKRDPPSARRCVNPRICSRITLTAFDFVCLCHQQHFLHLPPNVRLHRSNNNATALWTLLIAYLNNASILSSPQPKSLLLRLLFSCQNPCRLFSSLNPLFASEQMSVINITLLTFTHASAQLIIWLVYINYSSQVSLRQFNCRFAPSDGKYWRRHFRRQAFTVWMIETAIASGFV